MSTIEAHRRRLQRLLPRAIEAHIAAILAAAGMPVPSEAVFAEIRAGLLLPYPEAGVRELLRSGVPLDTMTDEQVLDWLVEDLRDADSQALLAQVKPS